MQSGGELSGNGGFLSCLHEEGGGSVNQLRACRGLNAAAVCDTAHAEQMSAPLVIKTPRQRRQVQN